MVVVVYWANLSLAEAWNRFRGVRSCGQNCILGSSLGLISRCGLEDVRPRPEASSDLARYTMAGWLHDRQDGFEEYQLFTPPRDTAAVLATIPMDVKGQLTSATMGPHCIHKPCKGSNIPIRCPSASDDDQVSTIRKYLYGSADPKYTDIDCDTMES